MIDLSLIQNATLYCTHQTWLLFKREMINFTMGMHFLKIQLIKNHTYRQKTISTSREEKGNHHFLIPLWCL